MGGQKLEKRAEMVKKISREERRVRRRMLEDQMTVEGRDERMKRQKQGREKIKSLQREAIDVADAYR